MSRAIPVTAKEYSLRMLSICHWLGVEKKEVLYNAGRILAAKEFKVYAASSLPEALTIVTDWYARSSLGRLEIDGVQGNILKTRIHQCATCVQATKDGHTYCWFDAGFIAGALETILGIKYSVVETKCRGTGSEYCEFVVIPPIKRFSRL